MSAETVLASSECLQDTAWPAGQDFLYRGLFRLLRPNDKLDKLSRLASSRQGVRPADLLWIPKEEYLQRGIPNAETWWYSFEKRRVAKIKVVEAERKQIAKEVITEAEKGPPYSSRLCEQLTLITAEELGIPVYKLQVMDVDVPIDLDAPEDVVAEQKALRTVLIGAVRQLESRMPRSAGADVTSPKVYREADKYKERELRQVNREKEFEVQSYKFYVQAEKEKEERELAEQKAQEEQRRLLMQSQRERRERLEQVRMASKNQQQQRQQRLAARIERRNKQEMTAKQEKEELTHLRALISHDRDRVVHDRLSLVKQRMEQHSDIQRQECEYKLELHAQRQEHQKLMKEQEREVRKMARLHRAIRMAQSLKRQEEEEEMWKAEVGVKDVAAQQRLVEVKAGLLRECDRKRATTEGKAARAERNRKLLELYQAQQVNLLLLNKLRKEGVLAERHREKQEELNARIELSQEKYLSFIDNKRRIEERQRFKGSLQRARVETEDKRIEEMEKVMQKQARQREMYLLELRKRKESVKRQIETLRAARVVKDLSPVQDVDFPAVLAPKTAVEPSPRRKPTSPQRAPPRLPSTDAHREVKQDPHNHTVDSSTLETISSNAPTLQPGGPTHELFTAVAGMDTAPRAHDEEAEEEREGSSTPKLRKTWDGAEVYAAYSTALPRPRPAIHSAPTTRRTKRNV